MAFEVKFKNHISSCKDQSIWGFTSLSYFEIELHHNLLEDWDVLDDDTLILLVLIIVKVGYSWFSFVHEKLVLLLFVHHQVLSGDHCDVIFIQRFCHPHDFVWFSCFCW
jgi:hypothetical protein